MSATVLLGALAGVTLAGAVTVVVTREMTRMLLGLGTLLLGVSGLYAYLGFDLLAVAELFVYVGGVLVLFLFAITAMGRDSSGRAIARRFDLGAAAVSAGLGVAIFLALRSALPAGGGAATTASIDATGSVLLGGLLPQFEGVGVLLLAALVAALAIVGGGDR